MSIASVYRYNKGSAHDGTRECWQEYISLSNTQEKSFGY